MTEENCRHTTLSFLSLSLLLLLAAPARAQTNWTWKDRDGHVHTRAELNRILDAHKVWIESGGKSGNPADLVGADLTNADLGAVNLGQGFLEGATLKGAKLAGAELDSAHLANSDLSGALLLSATLKQADLSRATLTGADLTRADLAGAELSQANCAQAEMAWVNLKGADLHAIDLSDADLFGANLSQVTVRSLKSPGEAYDVARLVRTNLRQVNLEGAELVGVDLSAARLDGADLAGALFEPADNPSVRGIAAAHDLAHLTFDKRPDALYQLRKEFHDAGFIAQERAVTYAIRRRQAALHRQGCRLSDIWEYSMARPVLLGHDAVLYDCGSYVLNRVFFDLTSQYGRDPGRPLALVFFFWFLFALLYGWFIEHSGPSGLYLVRQQNLRGQVHTQELQITPHPLGEPPAWKLPLYWLRERWRVARAALFFSLMCAFNVRLGSEGFGRWLRLLTREPYDIKAEGWTRTVAGAQSLLSLYLLVLWLLVNFARPFG